MSDPTFDFGTLSYLTQVRRLRGLAVAALAKYDVAYSRLTLVNHGENTTYRVDGEASDRYLLRIHRPRYQTDTGIVEEMEWLNALHSDTDLIVPNPVQNRAGTYLSKASAPGIPETRNCVLFEWIDMRFRCKSLGSKALRNVATATAKLQIHAVAYQTTPLKGRLTWDTEGLIGKTAHWGNIATVPGFEDSDRALVIEARDQAARELMKAEARSGTMGLIHADLHDGNYGFKGHDVAFIDFDDCGAGFWLYDTAVTLAALRTLPRFKHLRDAYLNSYAKRRPFGPSEAGLLDTLIFARFICTCAWVHSRSDNPDIAAHAEATRTRLLEATKRYLETGDPLPSL